MESSIHTDNALTTHWHVLGSGAMGCLWAAALQQAGHRVSLIVRNCAQLAHYPGHILIENAVTDDSRATERAPRPRERLEIAAWEPEYGPPAESRPVRWLIVATKAQDVSRALAGISPWLSADATVILLQNGLLVQQQLSAEYGDRVLCLSSSHGAWMRAPWHVVRAGIGEAWLGQLNARGVPPRLQKALQRLPAQETHLHYDANIEQRLWRKFAINCAINALTVVHDCRNGELLDGGRRQQQLHALCEEISTVLDALSRRNGSQIHDTADLLTPDLYTQVETVLRATAPNLSSTLQDVRRGRSTELPHLNGYLISLAESADVPAPRNIALMADIEHCARIPAHP